MDGDVQNDKEQIIVDFNVMETKPSHTYTDTDTHTNHSNCASAAAAAPKT